MQAHFTSEFVSSPTATVLNDCQNKLLCSFQYSEDSISNLLPQCSTCADIREHTHDNVTSWHVCTSSLSMLCSVEGTTYTYVQGSLVPRLSVLRREPGTEGTYTADVYTHNYDL